MSIMRMRIIIIMTIIVIIIVIPQCKFTAVKVGIRPTCKAGKYFSVTCINKANLFLAKEVGE